MPSNSFETWRTVRAKALNEIVAAHRMIGGTGRGRRYATQQINHAYAMLLSSQFQGFCRSLHAESIDQLVRSVGTSNLARILQAEFIHGRKLDHGNPNPGNIGADFNRLGLWFWQDVLAHDSQNQARKAALELLNEWRNAIAHQDFDPHRLGGINYLQIAHVRSWRAACDGLAVSFDEVLRVHLQNVTGKFPW